MDRNFELYYLQFNVMKNIKFFPNIWQTYPFILNLYQMDREGRHVKDLVLKNAYADELSVSEMNLNIIKLSALQSMGQEHFITDFPGQPSLHIKGMHAGVFLRSKTLLSLDPGTYTTLRFYLGKSGNRFLYSDRKEESADGLQYLDFDFTNGLTIEGTESPEALLRFDFAPFKRKSIFTTIRLLFKRPQVFSEMYN